MANELLSETDIDYYKGSIVLVLDKHSDYPFSFGVRKAKLILNNINKIQEFVDKYGDDD